MKRYLSLMLLIMSGLIVTGCSSEKEELVIYSGRSKPLVDGLVEQYKKKTEATVNVKYGKDAQLLAALKEEGKQSPADVFWANTTGALSNAVNNELFQKVPGTILDRADRFVPSNGYWVPVTTRFRVLAYNDNRIDPSNLPKSVLDLPKNTDLKGKIGWTPTYSSFQDFLTHLRLAKGDDVARKWLDGMKDLNPKSYTSNTPMITALSAGEIDVALTNHYYVLRLKHGGAEGEYEGHDEHEEDEEDEEKESPNKDAPVSTYHFAEGDPGNLALVTGAGIHSGSDNQSEAKRFLKFLLSKKAQSFAADQVNEYPVVPGSDVPNYMNPVGKALSLSPEFEPGQMSQIKGTLELLREEGIL